MDIAQLTSSLGVPEELARSVGIDDVLELIRNPPPGIDEIVALTSVIRLSKTGAYDRIVIDTAPTGHTLRLLQLPSFIESFAVKLIKFRAKIIGLIGTVKVCTRNAFDPPALSYAQACLCKTQPCLNPRYHTYVVMRC
jgi:arsenite-transporting ATPase